MTNTPTPSNSVVTEALTFYAEQWEQDVDAERTINGWEGTIGPVEPTEALRNDMGEKARAALAMQSANTTGDDADEAYEIGKRDGYEKAVQDIDLLTGGDGEYRYCMGVQDERHCPDAATMKARIAERFDSIISGTTGSDELVGKLQALRTMCASCGQPFYVEILDEVLAALNAIATPDTDRVAVLTEALRTIEGQALCYGMAAEETELRDWLRFIAETCAAALSQPLGSQGNSHGR